MAVEMKWYYVEKNERKGPVSFENLRQLVAKGTVADETLIWQEGMQDWERASTIKGLIKTPAKKLPPANVTPSRPNKTSQQNSAAITPMAKSTLKVGAGAAINPPTASIQSTRRAHEAPPAGETTDGELEFSASNPNREAPDSEMMMNNLMVKSKSIGYPCLIIGFLLVISGKGCDSLGSRWAKGTMVAADLAKNQFEASYDAKENSYQTQINDLNNSDDPNIDRIKSLNEKISELNKKRNAERRELQASTWANLNSNASMALDRYHSWGFTREPVFVFGSMVLSVGLLVVGITGQGSEKWVCLIMLAIITFSIYVGGFAWSASLQSVIPNVR